MFNNSQTIRDEEFKLLIRATRNELFHFIAVQYNHYNLVRKVKQDLVAQYPNRAVNYFNLEDCNFETLIKDILASESGLVFIEKFDLLFTENLRSLCIGFNQRRDLFSKWPIQIIVFIPTGNEYLQNFQKAMPDVFSIINPIIQLYEEIEVSKLNTNTLESNDISFANIEEANAEINRIENRLISLENKPENIKLIVSLQINLAQSYRFIGAYTKAKVLLKSLLADLETNKNLNFEEELTNVQNGLALVFQDLGEYEEARKLLEKAVISAEYYFGEKHPTTVATYSNLATVLRDLGEYERAKELLEKAVISDENNFGEKHPTTAIRYSNLAMVLRNLGEYEGAKKLLEKAMISDESTFGEKHPTTAIRYSNLATVLQNLGEYEGAKKLLEKAMISDESNFGEMHPNTAIGYSNLAMVLRDLWDYEGAKKLLEKARISDESNFGEKHPTTAATYSNLALVLKNLRDYKGAKKLLEKAYDIMKNHFGEEHPNTKIIKGNLEHLKNK